ncbi:MAG: hypothetical protein LBF49_00675 [Puniceicoccales bacterium]|jgi:hypothetical protein|nr:hypothetical protein [Puniceicoccales bacterium]
MDKINTTTNHETDIWEKMSLLKDKEQADRTGLHTSGDNPISRPEDRTLPLHSLSLRNTEAPVLEVVPAPVVAPRADPQQILAGAIVRAFFGRTDGIDGGAWAGVRTRLETMLFSEVRRIWQTIANEVAADCFDEDGKVDVERLKTWMEFFGDAENLEKEPFCLIPHAKLMCTQMQRVCECLFRNQNKARDRLDAANGITVGSYGRSLLDAMAESPLDPAVAILASLFTPHRQLGLPTCTMDSLITKEIMDHLERLILTYTQTLRDDQIIFPSGCAVKQLPIADGHIAVDLIKGGDEKNKVFGDVMGDNLFKKNHRLKVWDGEGIKYNSAEKYKLEIPVHNMNDVLFTHLLQVSRFGNWQMNADVTLAYAGLDGLNEIYSKVICISPSNFPEKIEVLKAQAKIQEELGYQYMRVGTMAKLDPEVVPGEPKRLDHSEIVKIEDLIALDLSTLKVGEAYPIGDRNWESDDRSEDIPRLAVRKGGDAIYEIGTLESTRDKTSKKFKPFDPYYSTHLGGTTSILVYNTNVKFHDAKYWTRYAPRVETHKRRIDITGKRDKQPRPRLYG